MWLRKTDDFLALFVAQQVILSGAPIAQEIACIAFNSCPGKMAERYKLQTSPVSRQEAAVNANIKENFARWRSQESELKAVIKTEANGQAKGVKFVRRYNPDFSKTPPNSSGILMTAASMEAARRQYQTEGRQAVNLWYKKSKAGIVGKVIDYKGSGEILQCNVTMETVSQFPREVVACVAILNPLILANAATLALNQSLGIGTEDRKDKANAYGKALDYSNADLPGLLWTLYRWTSSQPAVHVVESEGARPKGWHLTFEHPSGHLIRVPFPEPWQVNGAKPIYPSTVQDAVTYRLGLHERLTLYVVARRGLDDKAENQQFLYFVASESPYLSCIAQGATSEDCREYAVQTELLQNVAK